MPVGSRLLDGSKNVLLGLGLAHGRQERDAGDHGAGNARGGGSGADEKRRTVALARSLGDGALGDLAVVDAVAVEKVLDLGGDDGGRGDALTAGDDDLLHLVSSHHCEAVW